MKNFAWQGFALSMRLGDPFFLSFFLSGYDRDRSRDDSQSGETYCGGIGRMWM